MEKEEYIAPKLVVVSFKVEQGFTGSDLLNMSFTLQQDELPQNAQGNEASHFGVTAWEW